MKSTKIIFWATTSVLVLFQGFMPIFTYKMPEAAAGMRVLGYPAYFDLMLAIFKLIGGIALIVPQVPARIKEWAYAGFGLDFIAAFVSIAAVMGFNSGLLFPTIASLFLVVSYWSYHKLKDTKVII